MAQQSGVVGIDHLPLGNPRGAVLLYGSDVIWNHVE